MALLITLSRADYTCLNAHRVNNSVLYANTQLQFLGGAGHALRKSTAGAFGPDLAKKLSQLVKMEKNVMRSMELVGRERMEVAVC